MSRKVTDLQPWECLMKRIVWKQLGDIRNKKILDFGSGIGVTANYLAEHNDVTAIEPDEEKAVKYLKMAADEGHAESTFLLGIMYQSESGKVPYDMKKSLELIHESADMGWPLAMAILGRSYCNGRDGLEKDTETGKKWLKKSTRNSNEVNVWQRFQIRTPAKGLRRCLAMI